MSCTLQVETATHTYPVHIRHRARMESLQRVAALLHGEKAVVISDTTVSSLHAAQWAADLRDMGVRVHLLTMSPGEAHKTLETVGALATACIDHGVDRHTVVIAFGGGIVGDVAGFVASMLLRGVRWVQLPTTVLAQVDSSVGGKTGVNHAGGKNLIGAFYPPRLVFADTVWFSTLPTREVRAGLAEAIKHAVLADATLLDAIRQAARLDFKSAPDLSALIAAVVRIKADVVAADEREQGRRAILNFGHTLGHALEATWPGRWRHGEAVALGMAFDATRCCAQGLLSARECKILLDALTDCGLPVDWKPLITPAVLDKVARDKKIRGEYVNDVLLTGLGHPRIERVRLDAWQQMARQMAAPGA